MNELIVSIIIAIISVIISAISYMESVKIRKTTFRPILIPWRINEIINDDNLFSCNFEYPITEEILGEPKLVYFGVKNIGKGPAINVCVRKFESEDKNPDVFRVGSNIIGIPEEIIIPFIIRVARADDIEYSFITYTTQICYEDLFGNKFYLNIRIWINENTASVVEYNDKKKPRWNEYKTVVWREVESNGFFETRKIEEELRVKSD